MIKKLLIYCSTIFFMGCGGNSSYVKNEDTNKTLQPETQETNKDDYVVVITYNYPPDVCRLLEEGYRNTDTINQRAYIENNNITCEDFNVDSNNCIESRLYDDWEKTGFSCIQIIGD